MNAANVIGGLIDLLLNYGAKVPTVIDTVQAVIARFKHNDPSDPLAAFDTRMVVAILKERATANLEANRARIAALEAAVAESEALARRPTP